MSDGGQRGDGAAQAGGDLKPRALDLFCGAGGATRGLQLAGFHVTGVDLKPQPRYVGDVFHQADALTFPLDDCYTCQGTGNFYCHDEDGDFLRCDDCDGTGSARWDFIWASPPCQAFTKLRFMPDAKEHPNLIPDTRARLVASGTPYCIENVEDAPLGESGYLIMLCGTMFGLGTRDGSAELWRHRLFETSFSIPLRPACQHRTAPLGVYGGHVRDRCRVITVVGHTPVVPRSQRRAITITGSTPQTNVVTNRVRQTYSIDDAKAAMGIDWMTMAGLSQAIPPAYSEFIGRRILEAIR